MLTLTSFSLFKEEIEKFCILDIDPDTITWKRVTDCSSLTQWREVALHYPPFAYHATACKFGSGDKYLRKVEIGLSASEFSKKKNEQMKRTSSYGITVSSETQLFPVFSKFEKSPADLLAKADLLVQLS